MASKTKQIKLGYEIETGKEVFIRLSHLIVTGITQLSGKTTTLEALIKRSGLKAIVFKTKIGEKGFREGIIIPPFFKDRSDYEFVKSLIEAYTKEKLFLEKGTLMRLCRGTTNLVDIKVRVDDELANQRPRGLALEIYTRLQHYLENLIPQIQYSNLSKTLTMQEGINIMNLERFTEEAQSLIIQSVAEEVLNNNHDVILVIPETWKFLPQKYNNPCKRMVESFIRQGATNNNFVWLDSQDMAGVDKIPLKQISTWILGYQAERNEVKHTLDQISLPKKMKPKEDEIMNLKKGHFFLSSYDGVLKVYVQPAWLDDETAIEISKGQMNVEEIQEPTDLVTHTILAQQRTIPQIMSGYDDSEIKKDLIELRTDFFNKIEELVTSNQKIYEELYLIKNTKPQINTDEIVSKVLQKIPITTNSNQNISDYHFDKEAVIKEVLSRIPKTGNVIYEVAPLEKIKKDFLNEAKGKILSDISNLSNDGKKTLKYLESRGVGCKTSEIVSKGFLLTLGGGNQDRVNKSMRELVIVGFARKDAGGTNFSRLKDRIKELLSVHEATGDEIDQVYNNIIAGLI